MAADTIITVIGNLVASPELKYTPAGTPVANFTVASTPRRFDRASAQWKDGDPLFLPCHLWRDAAENLAESNLPRGARVIASGRFTQRAYETHEGHKRTVTELEIDEIGPSTRWATVSGVFRKTPVPSSVDPWDLAGGSSSEAETVSF